VNMRRGGGGKSELSKTREPRTRRAQENKCSALGQDGQEKGRKAKADPLAKGNEGNVRKQENLKEIKFGKASPPKPSAERSRTGEKKSRGAKGQEFDNLGGGGSPVV